MANGGAKVGSSRWVLICLPLLIGLPLGVYACLNAYLDGLRFVKGIPFGWVLWWAAVGIVVLAALVAALAALFDWPKHLKRRPAWACLVLLAALVAPAICLKVMPRFFYAGRRHAYASVDLQRLVDSCRQVEQLPSGQGEEDSDEGTEFVPGSAGFQKLPDYVRSLRPIFVWHRGGLVVIQMDGGGVMYHEGLAVAPNMPPDAFARLCQKPDLRILNPNYAVCVYRLYDWRIVPDTLIEEERPPPPSR